MPLPSRVAPDSPARVRVDCRLSTLNGAFITARQRSMQMPTHREGRVAVLDRASHPRQQDALAAGSRAPSRRDHLRSAHSRARCFSEIALARSLGVSRGPIREALGRLATEGLVTIRPRRGAVVRALSNEEFLEAYQVREALEMMAVRLAVPKLTAEDLARLERQIEEMALHGERR